MAWLLLPLLLNSTASGTFSHSPLLATYSAPAEPLANVGVEISPALAPAVTIVSWVVSLHSEGI